MTGISLTIDKRRQLNNGTYPIKVNVRHHSQFLISLGISAKIEEFDVKTGKFIGTSRQVELQNILLSNRINMLNKFIIEMEIAGRLSSMTDKMLKAKLEQCLDPDAHVRGFLDVMDEYIDTLRRPQTVRCYKQTRDKITAFDSNPTFAAMTYNWLTKFEQFLAPLSVNSISIHMRNIRSVFNHARKTEETTLYPFLHYTIKTEKIPVQVLTVDELRAIATVPIEPHLQRYRDVFMLSFYLIGTNLADIVSPESRINNGRFEFFRQKTGRFYSIKIEPEAAEILARYNNDPKKFIEGTTLTGLETSINRELKHFSYCTVIYGQGGKKVREPINPNVTYYHARRTWSTIAYNNCRIHKDDISQALGHKNGSEVTDHYIAYIFDAVDEANRKVIDYFLNGLNKTDISSSAEVYTLSSSSV